MTKKEIIAEISHRLSANPGYEVCVPFLERRLRNGRWGMRAYCITLDPISNVGIVCRPWSGSRFCWGARLNRLTKFELEYVLEKCPSIMG